MREGGREGQREREKEREKKGRGKDEERRELPCKYQASVLYFKSSYLPAE